MVVACFERAPATSPLAGDGNLEKPDTKRNRKVFHKSLSFLWIAHVDKCRQRGNS
jgi:hypothetical protein